MEGERMRERERERERESPQAGKAVLFFSYGPDYGLDHYAIHGSCPLERGHKAIGFRNNNENENDNDTTTTTTTNNNNNNNHKT